jgi:hypothetical protein
MKLKDKYIDFISGSDYADYYLDGDTKQQSYRQKQASEYQQTVSRNKPEGKFSKMFRQQDGKKKVSYTS